MSDFTMRFLESNTKLTHDDIEKILNYQEKAKEWDKATTLDSYEEFLIQKEIVKRLKNEMNRIDRLLVDLQNANWDEKITRREACNIYVKELQKLLGDKK